MQGVIGHDWAVRRLQMAIERGQLAQSHLFVGPESVGKATLALATAREVLSRGARNSARAVQLVEQRRHPDLTWVAPEEGGDSIKVDAVRELLRTLSLAPVESQHRVAVIDDAHLMTDSGKNAILKTLEEPNASVILILIAPSVDAVLPTIASRCQILNLRPSPLKAVAQALQTKGIERERAEFIARLSRGRVGWAMRAIEDESLLEDRKTQLDALQEMVHGNHTQRFAYAEKLAKQDDGVVRATLQEWLLLWRDVVQHFHQRGHLQLRSSDYQPLINDLADAVSLADAHEVLATLSQTQRYLQQNVNPRLALDVLLLKMPKI